MKSIIMFAVFLLGCLNLAAQDEFKIVERGFLYDGQLPPTCHAATLVETRKGDLIAAFYGGSRWGHPDCDIWTCRLNRKTGKWSAPAILADGIMTQYTRSAFDYEADLDMYPASDFDKSTWLEPAKQSGKPLRGLKTRKPCYNPVLFYNAKGNLVLDYKLGRNTRDWTGWEITSKNDGKTWSHPRALGHGQEDRHVVLGPVKNKPVSSKGRIIAGSSTETQDDWRVHFETSDDDGKTWTLRDVECESIKCIQPAILDLGDGHLKALCRTGSRRIGMCETFDNGDTWTKMKLTDLPSSNSGIDAVTLQDGRHLLVCNYTQQEWRRSPLTLLLSSDSEHWQKVLDLEGDDGNEYSYPAIIQTHDGDIWVLYTWQQKKIAFIHLKSV